MSFPQIIDKSDNGIHGPYCLTMKQLDDLWLEVFKEHYYDSEMRTWEEYTNPKYICVCTVNNIHDKVVNDS